MKALILVFASLCSLQAFAADSTVQVNAHRTLVNAWAASCLAVQRNPDPTKPPAVDIPPAYFDMPELSINNNTDNNLLLRMVRVKINIGPRAFYCTYQNDLLLASGLPETVAAHKSLAITCPLYCGGFDSEVKGTFPTTVEVFGYYQNDKGNQEPASFSTSMDITNPK